MVVFCHNPHLVFTTRQVADGLYLLLHRPLVDSISRNDDTALWGVHLEARWAHISVELPALLVPSWRASH